MAVSALRNSKKRKQRGNPSIASFIFNPIPGTQNTLFKEEVCTWDGIFQFLVAEWCCLVLARVGIFLCSDRAHAVSLPYQASQSSQTAARDSCSSVWKKQIFFSFSQLPFYYYGVFWTTADELCSIFMNIQLLSSFIPSWGVLMGTKWKDCCDSNATLGSPCSRGSWANLDVQATPLCCSFHPDRIMMCSSADHTLLKSSLGKNMVYCSLWL